MTCACFSVANAAEKLKETVKSLVSGNADISTVVGTIQQAAEALQHTDLSRRHDDDDTVYERVRWCSVPLPVKKPLVRTLCM